MHRATRNTPVRASAERGLGGLARAAALAVAFFLSTAPAAAEEGGPAGPDAADEAPSPPPFSCRISADYVPRWQQGTDYEDQDLYASVLLGWGGRADRLSGSVYWRGVRDLDEVSQSEADPFLSVYDTDWDGEYSHLYHAYVDLRAREGADLVRLGRQFIFEGQPFRFDGARYDFRTGGGGFRASVYAGVPAHYFDESTEGVWLAGLGLDLRPWRGGRTGLVYTHVGDDPRLLGLPAASEAGDLVVVTVGSLLGRWGAADVRYTAVERLTRTRDVAVRARASFEESDVHLSLSYYAQPEELSEFMAGLSPFGMIQGVRHPFSRVDFSTSKGFRAGEWGIDLVALAVARRLDVPAAQEEYNRDYDLLRLGLSIESPEPGRLSVDLGHAWWRSLDDDASAFDAEFVWKPSDAVRLGVGTTYSLYSYDLLGLAEETDVREAFLRLRWKASGRNAVRLRFASKTHDEGTIYRLRLGCSVQY